MTAAGLGGLALASVLLLCGAGNAPIENFTPQGAMQADLNAGGHNITNAASITTPAGAAYVQLDTNGLLPFDVHTANPDGMTFVFEGDSITYGMATPSPATQCFGYLFSQMAFARNHGTYYNDGVSSSTIAAGSSGGQTVTGSWTGTTTTITLTTSPTAPAGIMSVSGTNIPAGTTGTLSGSTLTLSQATTGSGTSVTLTLGGNNITDRYASQVRPHRPAANGGTGGVRAYLFVDAGTNDISGTTGSAYTAAQTLANLASYVAQARSDGFTVICATLLARPASTLAHETQRALFNSPLRAGQAASGVNYDRLVDYGAILDMNPITSNALNGGSAPYTGTSIVLNSIPAGLQVGMYLQDETNQRLAPGTQVTAINPGTNTITISAAASSGGIVGNGSLFFGFITTDGIHPTIAGNQVMATYLNNAMIAAGPLYNSSYAVANENANFRQGANLYPGLQTYGASVYGANGLYIDQSTIVPGTWPLFLSNLASGSTIDFALYNPNATTFGAKTQMAIGSSYSTGNVGLIGYVENGAGNTSNYLDLYCPGGTGDMQINGAGAVTFNGESVTATGPVTGASLNASSAQTTSGNVTFGEPLAGSGLKIVGFYCAGGSAAATYTFPTAFTVTPSANAISLPSGVTVSSISTTAITLAGSGTGVGYAIGF
jgi:lysophospholipase L1-like esterase